jgi:Tol biopolymer transport system component
VVGRQRGLIVVGFLSLALAVTFAPGGVWPIAAMQSGGAPTGELLYLNRGDIWRLDLATNSQSLLVHPPSGIITRLAHSPDGAEIAYTILYVDAMYRVLGGDLVISGADGRNPQVIVHEEELGYALGWPSWTADRNKLVYSKDNVTRLIWRIEEVDRTTGERMLIVEGGSAPSSSPTQSVLAYSMLKDARSTIWSLDRTTDAKTEVVKPDWFDDADNPSFAPDGQGFAFIAVGQGPPAGSQLPPMLSDLLAALAPGTAAAHDMPGALFDLWMAPSGGGPVRRVAQLFDMQPEITWSPDGRYIAVMGALQLQIVDVATGAKTSMARPNSSNQISWGRRSGS